MDLISSIMNYLHCEYYPFNTYNDYDCDNDFKTHLHRYYNSPSHTSLMFLLTHDSRGVIDFVYLLTKD